MTVHQRLPKENASRTRLVFDGVSLLFLAWLISTIVGFTPFASPDSLAELARNADSNPTRQWALIILFSVSVYAVGGFDLRRYAEKRAMPPLATLLFLFWCAASILWSNDPETSFRRILMLSIVVVTAFAFVARLGGQRAMAWMGYLLICILLINILSVFMSPYAVHVPGEAADVVGDWKGMFSHKNGAGAITAITCIFLLDRLIVKRSFTHLLLFFLSLFFLYKADSKTSIGMLFISVITALAYVQARRSRIGQAALWFAGFWLLVSAAAAVLLISDSFVEALNDPTLFTGRMGLWTTLLGISYDHLLGGFGYGAFWQTGGSVPFGFQDQFRTVWYADTTQGHNGYLDILIAVGFPGLILALWAFIARGAGEISRLILKDSPETFITTAIFIFFIGNNFLESSLARGTHPTWIVYLVVLASIINITQTAGHAKNSYP